MKETTMSDDAPRARCLGIAPGMPTDAMERTIESYGRLGFTFTFVGDGFAIAERDGVELHFAQRSDHDPARTATWVYLRVDDPDLLHAEWKSAGAERLREPHETDYGTWEGSHIDPAGNLLLFGCAFGERPREPCSGPCGPAA
jgi:hypothetical protein